MRHGIVDGFRWLGEVLLSIALVTGCHLPGTGQNSAVEARSGSSDVGLLLRASKAVYATGEPLELSLEVVNESPRPVTLEFRTAQRYDFLIQNVQGQEVWRWSAERMFAQVVGLETLSPNGGKLNYREVIRASLPQGSYTVIGVVPAVDARMSASIAITMQ